MKCGSGQGMRHEALECMNIEGQELGQRKMGRGTVWVAEGPMWPSD